MTVEQTRLGKYFNSRREKGIEGLQTLSVTLDRGLVRRDSLERRTETNLEPTDHLRVRPGDIAYNMMRMWQGASGLSTEDAIVSPAYVVLQPKPNTDPLFASYLLKHPHMVHLLWAYSYGLTSDRLRLYFNDFKRIPWELPPLPEQKKIAEILMTWDKAIETTEKLLANAEAQKKALMQQLLTGKRRLKGFEGEWRRLKLGDLCDGNLQTGPFGSQLHANEYITDLDGVAVVMPNAMIDETINYSRCSKVSKQKASLLARHKLKAGDLVFSRRGDVGRTALYRKGDPHAICGTGCLRARLTAEVDTEFLAQVLSLPTTSKWLEKNAVGQTMPNLNTSIVSNLPLEIPALAEQRHIAQILCTADRIQNNYRRDLTRKLDEKRALLQQLLTGKRRVNV